MVCPCVCVCVQISPLHKDTSHIGLGSHFTLVRPHLSLTNSICNNPASKQGHVLRCWGLGLQCRNLAGGDAVQPIYQHSCQTRESGKATSACEMEGVSSAKEEVSRVPGRRDSTCKGPEDAGKTRSAFQTEMLGEGGG